MTTCHGFGCCFNSLAQSKPFHVRNCRYTSPISTTKTAAKTTYCFLFIVQSRSGCRGQISEGETSLPQPHSVSYLCNLTSDLCNLFPPCSPVPSVVIAFAFY